MNLSQVSVEITEAQPDNKPKLRSEESRLVRLIEALQEVQNSKAWSTLKTEVFDNLVAVLDKDIKTEAEKLDPSTNKLNRIAGEMKWAKRYLDLSKFENEKRVELQNIRIQLHGKTD